MGAARRLREDEVREFLAWAREARLAQAQGELLGGVLQGLFAPAFDGGQLVFELTPMGEVFSKAQEVRG